MAKKQKLLAAERKVLQKLMNGPITWSRTKSGRLPASVEALPVWTA